jgi:hypothetical protein
MAVVSSRSMHVSARRKSCGGGKCRDEIYGCTIKSFAAGPKSLGKMTGFSLGPTIKRVCRRKKSRLSATKHRCKKSERQGKEYFSLGMTNCGCEEARRWDGSLQQTRVRRSSIAKSETRPQGGDCRGGPKATGC